MSGGGQKHIQIPLELKDGSQHFAVRNGNNAAWLCICGYRLPLLWGGNMTNAPVVCPECEKIFIGKAEKPQGSPYKICEISPREIKGEAQQQSPIPLEFGGGVRCSAIRVGNGGGANAAWMCICGNPSPLIWSRFLAQNCLHTVCSGCGRKFAGEGDGPDNVVEVRTAPFNSK